MTNKLAQSIVVCIALLVHVNSFSQPIIRVDSLTYLALGDSYTVGRFVATSGTFPYQLVDKLNSKGLKVASPAVIAQNGWRTDELFNGVIAAKPQPTFDFVTLLIGVNNQYQQRPRDVYQTEFVQLLNAAIILAKGSPQHVFVLSIPDWSVTPFANGRNLDKIAAEIDEYNRINKEATEKAGARYINITSLSRDGALDAEMVTADKLHPSARMYEWWVRRIASVILKEFKK